MEFECTKRFKEEYRKLRKNNSKIFQDLNKDLFSLSFDELFNHYQILGSKHLDFRLKKHRCRNSSRNQSASGGFRIYFHINYKTKKIRLMSIYCKVGKKSKITLTPDEEEEIKEELKQHNKNDCFIKLKIDKEKIDFLVPNKEKVLS